MRPSHGIKVDFIAAFEAHLSPDQVRSRLAETLLTPIIGPCEIPGCTQQHSYALRVSRHKYADYSWSVYENHGIHISIEELKLAAQCGQSASLCAFSVSSPGRTTGIPQYKIFTDDGDKPDHDAWYSSESEIRFIFNRLSAINEAKGAEGILALYTNSNCTLQAHIGSHVPSRGIHPVQAKRMLQFFSLFERTLDRVQNSKRIRRGPMDTLSFFNILADPTFGWRELKEYVPYLPFLNSHVNIKRLLMDKEISSNRTIEFGQHVATLDAEEVIAWLDVVESAVNWICNTEADVLQQYYWDRWFDIKYSLPQILVDIGAKTQTLQHYQQVLSPGGEYELKVYHATLEAAEGKSLFVLLQHIAIERFLNSNRADVGTVVNSKVMNGEYGWLPSGSPFAVPGAGLIIYREEDSYSYKNGVYLSSEEGTPSNSTPEGSSPPSSVASLSDEELGPGDSCSQVNEEETVERRDSGAEEDEGNANWVFLPKKKWPGPKVFETEGEVVETRRRRCSI